CAKSGSSAFDLW
nr:immunoglobulin heavy chain junction region [Macaca mulatta]